jgi:hypothetical protein
MFPTFQQLGLQVDRLSERAHRMRTSWCPLRAVIGRQLEAARDVSKGPIADLCECRQIILAVPMRGGLCLVSMPIRERNLRRRVVR